MTTGYIDEVVRDSLLRRAMHLDYERVYGILGGVGFALAGGALAGGTVHDYDIYPTDGRKFDLANLSSRLKPSETVVSYTRNAMTVRLADGQVVQFCTYSKPTLGELIASFDYAHVQAGIRFRGKGQPPQPADVEYTDAFIAANASGRTWYTSSEYPLSSAIRAMKYHAHKRMSRGTAARAMVKALADAIRRGFKDYADFKDQLDAIDLGLPNCAEARLLWDASCKAGLVKDPTCREHAE